MKKLLLPVGLALLPYIFFGCSFLDDSDPIDPWQLIPKNSYAVWEVSNLNELDSIIGYSGKNKVGFFLTQKSNLLNRRLLAFEFIGKKTESLLVLDAGDFDLDSLRQLPSKKRTYEGKDILDLKLDSVTLSFCVIQDVGLFATNSLLIEEAIRQLNSNGSSFKNTNEELFSVPALKQDGGNLYLAWGPFLKALESNKHSEQSEALMLRELFTTAVFDFESTGNRLHFSGFGIDSSNRKKTLLSTVDNQQPVRLQLFATVPYQFDVLLHMGISNSPDWYGKRLDFLKNDNGVEAGLASLRSVYSFDDNAFYQAIDDELIRYVSQNKEALFIDFKEVTKATNQLDRLQSVLKKEGKYHSEVYANYRIHTLLLPDFGYTLFSPLLTKSREFNYVFMDEVLLASPDIKFLQDLVSEIENENTIGKSLDWQKFLTNTQAESNISLFVNNDAGSVLGSTTNGSLLNRVNKFSMQFTRLERNYYASSFLLLNEQPTSSGTTAVSPSQNLLSMTSEAITPIYAVVNHNNFTNESIFQDDQLQLNLVDGSNKVIWKRKLDGKLVDQVMQIDFYKNRKLQYLATTPTSLYLIDRLGRNVSGFPVKLPTPNSRFLSVVDYNNTKDYRFLIADEKGTISIYDKTGTLLQGWNPKRLNEKLDIGPGHFRLASKDYFGSITSTGKIYLFNRRGEMVANYPKTTGFIPGGDVFGEQNALAFVSKDGHLIKISAEGKTLLDEVLLKSTNKALFQMVVSQDKSGYVIVSNEIGKLKVFDSVGKQLFEISNPLSENLQFGYYTFEKNLGVLVFFDNTQQLFFAIDETGKPLTNTPVEAVSFPAVAFDKKNASLKITYVKNKTLQVVYVQR